MFISWTIYKFRKRQKQRFENIITFIWTKLSPKSEYVSTRKLLSVCISTFNGNAGIIKKMYHCEYCQKLSYMRVYKHCLRCESVHYCSLEHQNLHWKQHKIYCNKSIIDDVNILRKLCDDINNAGIKNKQLIQSIDMLNESVIITFDRLRSSDQKDFKRFKLMTSDESLCIDHDEYISTTKLLFEMKLESHDITIRRWLVIGWVSIRELDLISDYIRSHAQGYN